MSDRPFLTARHDGKAFFHSSHDQMRVPWWSFSKSVLATAALKLVAEGACSLDDCLDDNGTLYESCSSIALAFPTTVVCVNITRKFGEARRRGQLRSF